MSLSCALIVQKYSLFCQVLIQCRATYIGSGQRQSFRLLVNSEYSSILQVNIPSVIVDVFNEKKYLSGGSTGDRDTRPLPLSGQIL